MKRIFIVTTPDELARSFSILKELRPHLSYEKFLNLYSEASAQQGYRMAVVESEGQIVALMGFRFITDFVRGRHLYIDDLVSTDSWRSRGLGAELLRYAELIAVESGCKTLRLCTALDNHRAVAFYSRNGWHKKAYAFTKKSTDADPKTTVTNPSLQ